MTGLQPPVVGVVIVTHGQLATELLNAVETIAGSLPQFTAVSIEWHDDVEQARADIATGISKVDRGAGVLIVTDLFGEAPANLSLTFWEAGRVDIVTGVNLPMLLHLAKVPAGSDLRALAREACDRAIMGIHVASDLLQRDGA